MKIQILQFTIREGVSAKGNAWKRLQAAVVYPDRFGKTNAGSLVCFENTPGMFADLKEGSTYELTFSGGLNTKTNQLEWSVSSFKKV